MKYKLYKYDEEYYKIYTKISDIDLNKIPSFKLLKQFLNVQEEEVILDAGCGAGHLLNYVIGNKNVESYGTDISDIALKIASEKFKNSFYVRQDIRNISFKDEMFDKILCFNVIEHIKEQNDVLLNFKRILKKNGILIIGTNIKDSIQWWLYQQLIGEHTHIHEFNIKEFKEFINKYFDVIDFKKSSGVFRFNPPLSWIFHYFLKGDIIIKSQKRNIV